MINQGDEVWGGKRLNGDYTKPAESGAHQPRGPRLIAEIITGREAYQDGSEDSNEDKGSY